MTSEDIARLGYVVHSALVSTVGGRMAEWPDVDPDTRAKYVQAVDLLRASPHNAAEAAAVMGYAHAASPAFVVFHAIVREQTPEREGAAVLFPFPVKAHGIVTVTPAPEPGPVVIPAGTGH
jgi:hypothetical protein